MSYVLAFVGFAALIILHELGHFAAAKAVGMRVERFALFFPPLLARVRRGETEYAVGAIPLGGYVKITGMSPAEEVPPAVAHRAYYRQPVWKRVFVISAGPAVNIALAFVILWGILAFSTIQEVTPRVESVSATAPAAGVLQAGDVVVAVDGQGGTQAELSRRIASHTCPDNLRRDGCRSETPVQITVERDGARRTFSLTPEYSADARRPVVGFAFERLLHDYSPAQAVGESVKRMWNFTTVTVTTLAQIFDPEVRKELSGVVGSYEMTRQAIEFGVVDALSLLAVISLSLGVINLFPFLPLDGGHIFWAVAEKVRGRAISFQTMERAGFVGFVLVIALFVIGLSNDIGRLRGEGFGI